MIPYERTRQQTIPHSAVKIIGVGGAGANMLDRIALDGMEGAELLACNTDVRTLTSSVAPEKIQIGRNLTKGLGTGGDPDLGRQAASEAELEIRDALRDRKIIFICAGLGGGTGSGAAPLVARLARESGAFTVVFATTPFNFEGKRRREQAETALNELSVLANALITFDNTRMGELVLAKQGVHEAFSAADRMISESIRAVTRIVMRPGLVNIGLDDLMAALSTPKSRCLFGSGLARGENRAQQALKNALVSPLLDRGSLLHDTQTVLVHVCGGEDLTLYELELLMRALSKHVPDTAQILFGTSVDPAMSEALSVTLVSSLPEERLLAGLDSDKEGTPSARASLDKDLEESFGSLGKPEKASEPESEEADAEASEPAAVKPAMSNLAPSPVSEPSAPPKPTETIDPDPDPDPDSDPDPDPDPDPKLEQEEEPLAVGEPEPVAMPTPVSKEEGRASALPAEKRSRFRPKKVRKMKSPKEEEKEAKEMQDGPESPDDVTELTVETPVKLPPVTEESVGKDTTMIKLPTKRSEKRALEDVFESAKGTDLDDFEASLALPEAAEEARETEPGADHEDPESNQVEDDTDVVSFETVEPSKGLGPIEHESLEEIQASAKAKRPQGELLLDGGPKGKFEGQDPNLLEGEDLDIPPFLRKKK